MKEIEEKFELSFDDLLTFLSLTTKRYEISLLIDGKQGRIEFESGEIEKAQIGDKVGDSALEEILNSKDIKVIAIKKIAKEQTLPVAIPTNVVDEIAGLKGFLGLFLLSPERKLLSQYHHLPSAERTIELLKELQELYEEFIIKEAKLVLNFLIFFFKHELLMMKFSPRYYIFILMERQSKLPLLKSIIRNF